MEYRKRTRRRRIQRLQRDSYFRSVICVIALFGAIVYLIGVSSVGSWVAKNVVAPAFRTLGIYDAEPLYIGEDAAEATTLSDLKTETLRFPESTYYALQMGVYTNLENASKQAAALQSLGAAGYILNKDGKYRVLAACYPDESSLSAVRAQLTSEGLESAAYLFERATTEWIVTASETQIDVLQTAMQALIDLSDRLYAVVYAFDDEKQELSVGQAAIATLQSELKAHQSALLSGIGGGNYVASQLCACYETILAAFQDVLDYNGDDSVFFSAKLKHVLLSAEGAICTFVEVVEDM